ncbi:MAG: hypothetical protein HFG20_07785 [Anaerotruncus sp.]|jgi:hypothetical protein|nr:hypothetical protein [Anaerotruncus sp.]
MSLLLPILTIVAANTIYNLCTHAVPPTANPFAAILVTYITAGLLSTVLLLFSTKGQPLLAEFGKVNLASVGLGFGIVLLESGFIAAFRAGWRISTCALVANLLLAIVLFAVGVIFFQDAITLKKVAGIAICILGLYLVNQ